LSYILRSHTYKSMNTTSMFESFTVTVIQEVADKIRVVANQHGCEVSAIVSDVLADLALGEFSTAEVAVEIGVTAQVVRQNWKKWGLRVIGRGPHGRLRFSKASVFELKYKRKYGE